MTGTIYNDLLQNEGAENKVEGVVDIESGAEENIEGPLKMDEEVIKSSKPPRPQSPEPKPEVEESEESEESETEVIEESTDDKDVADYYENETKVEEIEEAVDIQPIENEVKRPTKVRQHENLIFDGDKFLTSELNPGLYASANDTLAIPLDEKDLYRTKVNLENIEAIIKKAFDFNPRRVSFSLEELGLHNRLIEMGIPQDLEEFILVRTSKGNVVVHKTATSKTDIESVFMGEAKACLSKGQRIVIPLLESYKFRDNLGIVSERYRYRASLSEIKGFVARTGMKATITKDSFLVVYE